MGPLECPASPRGWKDFQYEDLSYAAYSNPCIAEAVFVCMLSRFSHVRLFATLWTLAQQAPLSNGFSRQEYWSGSHALLQGIFPTQGLNPHLLCLLHWRVGPLLLANK